MDGSFFGNQGSAGFSGLLRDSNGIWIHGFSGSCGTTSNIFAELSTIWVGLQLATDIGHKFIIFEFDSKNVMDLIEDVHNSNFHPRWTILSLIRKLSSPL